MLDARKCSIFSGRWSKRKMVIKIEFTPLPDCNTLPFYKGFLKTDLPTDSFLLGLSFTDLGETSCDEPSETNQILQVRNVAQLS